MLAVVSAVAVLVLLPIDWADTPSRPANDGGGVVAAFKIHRGMLEADVERILGERGSSLFFSNFWFVPNIGWTTCKTYRGGRLWVDYVHVEGDSPRVSSVTLRPSDQR